MMKKAWHQQIQRAPKERRTSPDGVVHASVEESHRWAKLKRDEALGLVRGLQRQVSYPLVIDDKRAVRTPTGRVAVYKPDFVYERQQDDGTWSQVIEDHKGYMDRIAELRISIFEAIYSTKVYIHKK